MHCLYTLTFPNSKKYIGITRNFNRRMSQHKYEAIKNKSRLKLYCAIRKYGWDNIKKEIIHTNLSEIEALHMEEALIHNYNSTVEGYNTASKSVEQSKSLSEFMKKRMADPEQKSRALAGLHSVESKRKQLGWTTSETARALSRERGLKAFSEGNCSLPIKRKPVRCLETGETFSSVCEAAKKFNGKRNHLREHLNYPTKRKLFKGLHFEKIGNY